MKYIFLIAVTSLCSLQTRAQTITKKAFNFSIGDTLSYISCDTAGVIAGNGGVNRVWNFSNLTTKNEIGIRIKAINKVPQGTLFPTADYAEVYSSGVCNFVKQTDSTYNYIGAYDGAASTVKYEKGQLKLFRPLAYLQEYKDSFVTNGVFSGISYSGIGKVTVACDGYGTLQLPGLSNATVTRVKVLTVEYDTIHTVPQVETITYTTSFIWFDSLRVASLLRIDSIYIQAPAQDYVLKTVAYLKDELLAGVNDIASTALKPLQVMFDKDELLVQTKLTVGHQYKITLYDLNGGMVSQQVFYANGNNNRISIGKSLPAGVYIIRLHHKNEAPWVCKAIKAQ